MYSRCCTQARQNSRIKKLLTLWFDINQDQLFRNQSINISGVETFILVSFSLGFYIKG